MKSVAVISSLYPSNENHYSHTFVHTRSLYLKSQNINITVFVPSKESKQYHFDGVLVKCCPSIDIVQELILFDLVYLHLLHIKPILKLSGWPIYKFLMNNNIPTSVYIHGAEVQKVTSRVFDFKMTLKFFLTLLYKDYVYIPKIKRFYSNLLKSNRFLIMTPSLWMKMEAESNLNLSLPDTAVIPNGIDTKRFTKLNQSRYEKRILSIRQFTSEKYAVDISIKMMVYLPDFILDLYGKGPKLQEFIRLAKKIGVEDRINFIDSFISNKDMPSLMNKYKYFSCPTRMDAQGVSMCEAMACGCVVLTNSNTAIPEFVSNYHNGICCETELELANSVIFLENNPDDYIKISKNAALSMANIDTDIVMQKEYLALIALYSRSQHHGR